MWNIAIVNQKLPDKIVEIHGWPTPGKFDEQPSEIAWHKQTNYKKSILMFYMKPQAIFMKSTRCEVILPGSSGLLLHFENLLSEMQRRRLREVPAEKRQD